jgi:hypothetical protein
MDDPVLNTWNDYRTAIANAELTTPPDDEAYWRACTPDERLEALELMRWMTYGQAACTRRMQRVIEVIHLPRDYFRRP